MSITRRACRVVLGNLALLGLLAFMQSAGAAPQQEKAQAAKAAETKDDKKADAKEEKKEEKKEAAPAVAEKKGGKAKKTAVPTPPGGVAPPPADNEFTDAITLPTNRDIKNRLQLASLDYIPGKEWGLAAKLLQGILDSKEDYYVPVKRKGADGKEKIRWVSAKAEANRLLGSKEMQGEGLQFYEVQYGGQAKKLLADAKKNGDPQVLAEVALKYFHTDVGVEATDLLGTYHLDRGRPLMAALCYDRLLHREGADQLSGFTLFKAALAFRMTGDQSNAQLAKQTLQQMIAKVGRDGIQVGDDTVTLEQLQKELDRAAAPEAYAAYDWPMFRGNLSRSAIGRGSAPFLESKWQKSNLDLNLPSSEQPKLNPATRQWVEEAIRQQQYKPEPMIPAFSPIATGNKLIYRSFWGIHCVDVKTGELQWDSQTTAGLDALVRDLNKKGDVQNWFTMYKQGANQNIIFENSVVGTLSTDNTRIYAVDDLALPPHPTATQGNPWGWNGGGANMGGPITELANRSRLVAIDLETGKLVWEHGDPQHDTTELAASYFLGPPLPLAGKLYALTEKNGELRLVCLDAGDGKVTWAQTLATAKDKLLADVNRRVQAVNLSYAEGILVCPTNAGAVLGIDLLSRSLVWAFPYREKSKEPNAEQDHLRARRMMMGWPNQDGGLQKLSGEWKMSAPVIQDGKVVFTAPDGSGIHCLNLQDGEPLWQAERRDDLYLAGVFGGKVLLVGKNSCRALSLADGKKELWKVDTGVPSGMGVASGNVYYLPLKKGEVYKIDLDRGAVAAKSPSPKNAKGEHEVPGNLLFYDGDVVSQTETTVTCYPQVEFRVAQIDALLQKNPKDPVLLTERGEVRLYKGDLPGAVADLRAAVGNNPPPAMLAKTKGKLYTTLTELMQLDFNTAEQYLDEYRALCQVHVPAEAAPEERQRLEEEQRQRHAGYLCLLAKGREGQGRLVEAFQAYLDFGSLAENKELVTVINERAVKARPDVWAQGRIAGLVARATPEQRKPLEEEIARRWQAVHDSKDPTALPRFVAAFGSLFAAGREARLQLAERQMEANAFLDAELNLLQLRGQTEDPKLAARAVEALARLMTRKGLLEDAAHYYRILGRDYATVVVRDGKTGADFFKELTTDKRFLPYLDELVSPLLGASVKVMEVPGGIMLPQQYLPFESRGDPSPFFQRYRLAWTLVHGSGTNSFQLKLLDRDTNETRWTVTAPATRATYSYMGMANSRFPYYSKGHMVVLYLGHVVYALDLVEQKTLWSKDLLSPDRFNMEQPYFQYLLTLDREGALHLSNPQGANERLGQIGPVTSSYVCLRTQEGLVALDPVHGTKLWEKTDLAPQTQLFGDDEYVYLVEMRDDNRISSTKALRGRDGAAVEVPDFAAAFQRRQKAFGGQLLVSENDPTGGLVLRLYDIRSGKDLWKKNLPPNAVVLKGEEPELTAVVEPDGKLTVVDLLRREEVFHATVQPAHLDKVRDGWLLRDGKHYFAILNRPAEAAQNNMQGPWSNVFALRTETVNGMVYAFDRPTAKLAWYRDVRNQMILLEQFQEMPMMVFTAKYQKMMNQPVSFTPVAETLGVDKRTGKLIWERQAYSNSPQSQGQFHGLHVDRQAGIIDLISHNMRLRFYVGESAARAGAYHGGPRATQAAEAPRTRIMPPPAALREN